MVGGDFKITTGRKEYLDQAIELLTKCFWDDPAIRYMLCDLSDEKRRTIYPPYVGALVKAAYFNAALIDEGKDWSSVAIWMPPERRVDGVIGMLRAGFIPWLMKLGLTGIKRMLVDFQKQSDECKRIGLRDASGRPLKRYHYMFFLATDSKARGQGMASKMVAKYQKKATEDGMPIWLEATTKHSRDIYERCGFQEVKEMRMGQGTHSAGGYYEKGGPGVSLWSMIWWPANMRH